jgi:hypothetical protein
MKFILPNRCLNCGGNDIVPVYDLDDYDEDGHVYMICSECGSFGESFKWYKGMYHQAEEKAIESWNSFNKE